jgi:hypothetical protein
MRIIHFTDPRIGRCLGVVQDQGVINVTQRAPSLTSVHAAFAAARKSGRKLADWLREVIGRGSPTALLSYAELLASGRVAPPLTEEPGTRLLVSGTGLTHTGSVQQRDTMHKAQATGGPISDSWKMFEMGLAGGHPDPGKRGTAPEWFYKGDGRILRGPGAPLDIPPFAPDGGEEPEVAGLYIVDAQGIPCRLGFTQGNEWSDHVTENVNYLYLAPSKLRTCAIGPELVTDLAFDDVRGRCRVLRNGQAIYDSGELLTGQENMCHSLANLEDHHFKYPQHRYPGDLHVHFFGTSMLSFRKRDWQYQAGDVVEIGFHGLGEPLRNPVRRLEAEPAPIQTALG